MKHSIVQFIYKYLSGNPNEWHVIPGSECRLEFGEIDDGKPMFVATTLVEDGFELWIAYNNDGKWTFHCGAKYARQLAWFILWNWWIVSTWCGLKRKLWYWSNREMLDMWRSKQR